MYLFLAVLSLHCCAQTFSSCEAWGLPFSCGARASHCSGFSCCGASIFAACGLSSCGPWLQSPGSVAVVYWLSCPAACAILPDQGLNWRLALQGTFLTTGSPGNPNNLFLNGVRKESNAASFVSSIVSAHNDLQYKFLNNHWLNSSLRHFEAWFWNVQIGLLWLLRLYNKGSQASVCQGPPPEFLIQ